MFKQGLATFQSMFWAQTSILNT